MDTMPQFQSLPESIVLRTEYGEPFNVSRNLYTQSDILRNAAEDLGSNTAIPVPIPADQWRQIAYFLEQPKEQRLAAIMSRPDGWHNLGDLLQQSIYLGIDDLAHCFKTRLTAELNRIGVHTVLNSTQIDKPWLHMVDPYTKSVAFNSLQPEILRYLLDHILNFSMPIEGRVAAISNNGRYIATLEIPVGHAGNGAILTEESSPFIVRLYDKYGKNCIIQKTVPSCVFNHCEWTGIRIYKSTPIPFIAFSDDDRTPFYFIVKTGRLILSRYAINRLSGNITEESIATDRFAYLGLDRKDKELYDSDYDFFQHERNGWQRLDTLDQTTDNSLRLVKHGDRVELRDIQNEETLLTMEGRDVFLHQEHGLHFVISNSDTVYHPDVWDIRKIWVLLKNLTVAQAAMLDRLYRAHIMQQRVLLYESQAMDELFMSLPQLIRDLFNDTVIRETLWQIFDGEAAPAEVPRHCFIKVLSDDTVQDFGEAIIPDAAGSQPQPFQLNSLTKAQFEIIGFLYRTRNRQERVFLDEDWNELFMSLPQNIRDLFNDTVIRPKPRQAIVREVVSTQATGWRLRVFHPRNLYCLCYAVLHLPYAVLHLPYYVLTHYKHDPSLQKHLKKTIIGAVAIGTSLVGLKIIANRYRSVISSNIYKWNKVQAVVARTLASAGQNCLKAARIAAHACKVFLAKLVRK
jgi:hypothetical protein